MPNISLQGAQHKLPELIKLVEETVDTLIIKEYQYFDPNRQTHAGHG